jgi:hypothetical protein
MVQFLYNIVEVYDVNDVLIQHDGMKYRIRLRDNTVDVVSADYTSTAEEQSRQIALTISS